jgi:plastocyanin
MKRKLAASALAATALAGAAVPALAASSKSVTVKNFAFSPKTLSISRGTTVTWTWANTQGVRHDVAVKSGPVKFASAKKTSGTYSHLFTKAGTYHLYCTIHPALMNATITVH